MIVEITKINHKTSNGNVIQCYVKEISNFIDVYNVYKHELQIGDMIEIDCIKGLSYSFKFLRMANVIRILQ